MRDESLEQGKVDFLAALFPQGNLAMAPTLSDKLLRGFYKLDSIIPKARDKDLTHLSSVLGRGEEDLIHAYYLVQQRLRDILRGILSSLYSADETLPLSNNPPSSERGMRFLFWCWICFYGL